MTPKWVPKAVVLAVHDGQIAEHGGARGIRSNHLLESALAAPQQLHTYGAPDFHDLAAKYAAALTLDHPLHDGNKRVAFIVAGVFLELNGLRLEASEAAAATTMLALSAGDLDEAGYAAWLRQNTASAKGGSHPSAAAGQRVVRVARRKQK